MSEPDKKRLRPSHESESPLKKQAKLDDQSTNQSTNQSANQSTNQSTNQSINQSNDDLDDEDKKAALIAEEYRVWKKNSPYLYDVIMQTALDWPSLTVQWLNDRWSPNDQSISQSTNQSDASKADYTVQRLLLGTHTSGGEQNYLMFADVKLPSLDATIDASQFALDTDNQSNTSHQSKIEVTQRIIHNGEVNRARCMPTNQNLIATRPGAALPYTYLFDRTHYSSKPSADSVFAPDLTLIGHDAEGFGLAWNAHAEGQLLTCGADGRINLYHIEKKAFHRELSPFHSINEAHDENVNDVQWHCMESDIFGSSGDDSLVKLWDARTLTSSINTITINTPTINSISFNPFDANLIAAGCGDGIVRIIDRRNTSNILHTLTFHTEAVTQVAWSPFDADVIGSGSDDRRVALWDLSRAGSEQDTKSTIQAANAEDDDQGPPELLFVHGGHTDCIGEFSWNPSEGEEWTVASCADDNCVQIWQPASNIYDEDGDEQTVTDNKQPTEIL